MCCSSLYAFVPALCSAESFSPSTPGVSAHLRPRIVALREELDHSNAGEHGGKEQCMLFVGEVPLEAELMPVFQLIFTSLCSP